MITENLKTQRIKNIKGKRRPQENTPDFHIDSLENDTIIDLQNGGLDDIEEFNCSMYNFGDMENLPESDRRMIASDQTCRDFQP